MSAAEPLPRNGLAVTADALTFLRAWCALALLGAIARGWLTTAALLLSFSWVSDALDGRAARASGTPTRLGRWDLTVDTTVGAATVVGLGLGGYFPAWLSVLGVVVFLLGYLRFRSIALGMLVQGLGYAGLLWVLWSERVPLWWLPAVAALLIAAADIRRLPDVILPEFFDSLRRLFRLESDPTRSLDITRGRKP